MGWAIMLDNIHFHLLGTKGNNMKFYLARQYIPLVISLHDYASL